MYFFRSVISSIVFGTVRILVVISPNLAFRLYVLSLARCAISFSSLS